MGCMDIGTVQLSPTSLAAIEEIKRVTGLADLLTKIMPVGTMVNIFAGNGVGKSAFNISQTDFAALAQAVAAVPAIHRRVIQNIAADQALRHSGKESEFWRNIAYGCSVR